MDQVDRLMRKGIEEHVFPGGVLLAAKDGTVRFFKSYGYANLDTKQTVTGETYFDLASLTKPLATTLAVMKLVQQSKLALDQTIETILEPFKNTPKGRISIRQLLTHTSGLPDYRPYHKQLKHVPGAEKRLALRGFLVNEPLEYPAGERTVYSDLGFMILSWIVEIVSGKRLDQFVADNIYTPLGIKNLLFIDVRKPVPKKPFAATERCPWRKQMIQGVVHDENAYAAGGIEGHAGLFGTAHDVYHLLSVLSAVFHGQLKTEIIDEDLLRLFLIRHRGFERAFGFDTPSVHHSSSGRYFSSSTVGHLGFTGTSFWLDLEQDVSVILLTNRIHPTRTNEKIKAFRPRLHDTVMMSFKK